MSRAPARPARATVPPDGPAMTLRSLGAGDLEGVVRIDARTTGRRKAAWWRKVFDRFLRPEEPGGEIGLGAVVDGVLVGFVFGEVRAFEFGSEACGWVFGIGVDPDHRRAGAASALLEAALARFRAAGVTRVRTMVRRNDVPLLALFRSQGWRGGPFVQLERDLDEAQDAGDGPLGGRTA